MKFSVPNTIPEKEIYILLSNPEVIRAKLKLSFLPKVNFTINLPNSIKSHLKQNIGIDLFSVKDVPMTWIRGNIPEYTYADSKEIHEISFIYLSSSEGEFLIDKTSYPIQIGRGFVYSKGYTTETRALDSTPRILIGPMAQDYTPI
jgi:hypothetical protein